MKFNHIISTMLIVSRPIHCDGFSNACPRCTSRQKNLSRQSAVVDPNSLIQHVMAVQGASTTGESGQHIDALLSTLYNTGVAYGHSNPLFGPPDPYLQAAKSIAPLVTPDTPAPDLSPDLQEMVSKGVKVMDTSNIKPEQRLPGIVYPVRTVLDRGPMSSDYLATFSAKANWASSFINVFDKLALASFVYCLVEFFFLRPNVDLYKSEIEQESPTSLLAEALATFAVRVLAMGLVALLTVAIF